VRLRNWTSGQFEDVAQYAIGTTEEAVDIDAAAAERVRAADGRIELSIRHSVIATFSLAGFDSFFDQLHVLLD
jgi:hypothetical protein